MLDIYGKDEKEDLSSDEKKFLSELSDELRAKAVAAVQQTARSRKKGRKS